MKKKSKKPDKPDKKPENIITLHDKLPLVHIACLVLLILIIYANTFIAPFQWDEKGFIVDNPIIKDLHYFANPSDAQGFELYSSLISRYIGYLTFAVNYKIHGLSVTGYHIVNIAIHIANSILVYLFVLLTFKTPFLETSSLKSHSRNVAFFSALVFAAHPLQTEAVTYVFQRFASLAAFFYLLSLAAYIKSRLMADGEARLKGKERYLRLFFYSVSLISAVLAMKTKENAFTLPFVITLYELCFFSGPSPRDSASGRQYSTRLRYLVPILLTLVVVPLTLISVTNSGGSGVSLLNPGSFGSAEFSQRDYLITQFRVIVTYLRLLFFPVNQDLDYDYPVFNSFFDPQVMLSFAFLAALFVLGIYLVVKSQAKVKAAADLRILGFGILWFFITLSVESSIIPLPMLIDEYRVYLPSVGVIIGVVAGVFLLKQKMHSPKAGKIIPVALALVIGVLSIATHLRNADWSDGIRLWEDTAKRSPGKPRVHNNLGLVYQDRNMSDKAMEQYLIAIKLKPDLSMAHYNLGLIYKSLNMPDKAMEQYLITIKLKPDDAETHNNLGLVYKSLNLPDKAMEQYLIAIKLKPDDAEAHDNLGIIYQTRNMPDQAGEEFLAAVKLKPDDARIHFNLGVFYKSRNMPDQAMNHYLIAIKLKPDFPEAHNNLGGIYLANDMHGKAEEEFLTAIRLKPGFAEPHFYLGYTYFKMGQMEKARRELTRGLEIKPDNQQFRQLLKKLSSEQ